MSVITSPVSSQRQVIGTEYRETLVPQPPIVSTIAYQGEKQRIGHRVSHMVEDHGDHYLDRFKHTDVTYNPGVQYRQEVQPRPPLVSYQPITEFVEHKQVSVVPDPHIDYEHRNKIVNTI